MSTKSVLVLCTGNSARSQIAEGLINHFLRKEWRAFSAGTKPAGYVHPLAIYAMSELGIDIAGHHSKSVNEFRGQSFDLVVTVCDSASEACPLWLGGGKQIHMGFADPAAVEGSESLQVQAFRQVRNEIREKLLGELQSSSVAK